MQNTRWCHHRSCFLRITDSVLTALPARRGTQSFPFLRSCAGRSVGLGFPWGPELGDSLAPGKHSALPWSWMAAGWPPSWPDPSVWWQAHRWCRVWGCWEHTLQPSSPAGTPRHIHQPSPCTFLFFTLSQDLCWISSFWFFTVWSLCWMWFFFGSDYKTCCQNDAEGEVIFSSFTPFL